MSTTTITLNATITTSTKDEGSTTASLRQLLSQWNVYGPEGCCAYSDEPKSAAGLRHAALGAADDLLDQVNESGDIADIRRGLEHLIQAVSELRADSAGTEAAMLRVVTPLAAAAVVVDGETLTEQGLGVICEVVCDFELAMRRFTRGCVEGVLEHQRHDAEAEVIEKALHEREPQGPPASNHRPTPWGRAVRAHGRRSPWHEGTMGMPYHG